MMHIMGVDEAGRGPLAGPVVAAAVVWDSTKSFPSGLADSKTVSARKRAELELAIKSTSLVWAIGHASVEEIDRLNILNASMLAMRRAIAKCGMLNALALVDGPFCPKSGIPEIAIIRGDSKVPQISAASILAKQARDRDMEILANTHAQYGFDIHMGYPTKMHLEKLRVFGPCPAHRRSFGPVKKVLNDIAFLS